MKIKKKFFTLIFFLLCRLSCCLATFKKVCYFTNWAQSRPSGGDFYPEDIEPELCTHIIYAFAKIENYTLAPTEAIDMGIDDGLGLYERIMVLKIIDPKLKILLAVGGWAQGSAGFDTVVETDQTMKTFAQNSIKFLRKWEFDGLDVDWEFPVVKKKEFTRLLEILRNEFDNENPKNKTLELSIAVSGGQATIDTSYEVDKISQYVDFVNLMAYDFHGSWSVKTGYHSALYPNTGDLSWENTLNVDWSVNYWLKKGCPKEKLILGLAFYGRGFKLANQAQTKNGSPSRGSSKAGKYTKEAGFLSFFEICQIKKEKKLAEKFDNELGVPSLIFDNQWIGYENQESVILKASYIKDKCLGGAMIWTIDFDDFKGAFCDEGTYPLMKILNEVLNDSECYESTKSMVEQKIASSEKSDITASDDTGIEFNVTTTTEEINLETSVELEPENSTKKSPIKNSSSETLDINVELSYQCNGTTLIPSFVGCEFYQVCLKGLENPTAILKCPDNLWFDLELQTCTENKPVNCVTKVQSTTLVSNISPNYTLFAYATEPVIELINSTENNETQSLQETTKITFITPEIVPTTHSQKNDSVSSTVIAYVTPETTSVDQELSNESENTTVLAYVTPENNITFITNQYTFPGNTTVFSYIIPETDLSTNQSDSTMLPNTTIINYVSPENIDINNQAILNTTVMVYIDPNQTDSVDSTESETTKTSETTLFAFASTETSKEPETSENSFTSTSTLTVTQDLTLETTTVQNDDFTFKCPQASGLFRNQENCHRFWHCSNYVPFDKKCPGNLVFDSKLKICAWSSDSCKQSLQKLLSYDLMRSSTYQKLSLPVYQMHDVFVCPEPNGLFENQKNCRTFWQCFRAVPYLKMCPGNLVFNKDVGVCDYHSSCNDKNSD